MRVAVIAACIPYCNCGNVVATAQDCLVVIEPPLHSAREVITGLPLCFLRLKVFGPVPAAAGPTKLFVVE